MRILLGNIFLSSFGGTESWTRTLALAFKELGHEVFLYSDSFGKFSEEHLTEFSRVSLQQIPGDIDLAILNHVPVFEKLKSKSFFKIYVSHGFFDPVGRCVPGADAYVCVSPEIYEIEKARGYECEVIFNPINTHRFFPKELINKELKNVLLLSKGASLAEEVVKKACSDLNLNLILHRNEIFNVESLINQADLVIAIGRCLIESMACGRNVVSGDYRIWMKGFEGAGTITKDNFYVAQKSHYSGRGNPIHFDVARLKEELIQYKQKRGEELRRLCLKDHDYLRVAKKYLEIYERRKHN